MGDLINALPLLPPGLAQGALLWAIAVTGALAIRQRSH